MEQPPLTVRSWSSITASGNMQDQQRLARNDHDVTRCTVISSKPGSQGHVSPEQSDELTTTRDAFPTAVLRD